MIKWTFGQTNPIFLKFLLKKLSDIKSHHTMRERNVPKKIKSINNFRTKRSEKRLRKENEQKEREMERSTCNQDHLYEKEFFAQLNKFISDGCKKR